MPGITCRCINILSFSYWAGEAVHDTSAALVCDGEVVAVAEEERFTRVKYEASLPLNAINSCLHEGGLTMQEVDLIAFPDKPFWTGPNSGVASHDRATIWRLYREGNVRARMLLHWAALSAYLTLSGSRTRPSADPAPSEAFASVRDEHGPLPPVRYYEHHQAHAAMAYLTSGLDAAAIATMDGRGGPYSSVTWAGAGGQIRRLRAEPWSNSLGSFYRDCTHYLGLGEFGEGKTMGLSAYGDPAKLSTEAASLLEVPSGGRWYRYREQPSESLLGFAAREGREATDQPYPEFAAAVQRQLEQAIERVVDSACEQAGAAALCLAGGVALNCAANGRLLAERRPDPVWAYAAAGDAGLSLGAALLAAQEAGELETRRLDHAYLGPSFDDAVIESALASTPAVTFHRSTRVAEEVAERLARGEIVGWFQGRMELGPRALGNRSILADPRSVDVRDRVNRLKGREAWRPLAPSVIADRASEYFELASESPFMLFAAAVRPSARELLAGIVHVDGTARPQTVRQSQNAKLYALLQEFERHTGVPVVLNTSFNAAGEPIVCRPEDAISTFLATGLDALVCGDFIAEPAE